MLDYFDKNWSDVFQLDQQNMDLSIESFLNNMNSILDYNASFKRVNKYKLSEHSGRLIFIFLIKKIGFVP